MTAHCEDRALAVIVTAMNCLGELYSKSLACPPKGGAAREVAFFAGDAVALDEIGCEAPFLWVRFDSRHRSDVFPEPAQRLSPCGGMDVIVIELGVARCAGLSTDPSARDKESEIALDDTRRLGFALCVIAKELGEDHQVAADPIQAYGPEGGQIIWTTTLYISV